MDRSRSLWLDTATPTAYSALDRDVEVDVAIIGAGIAGVTTALLLKRDGARVAVLERGAVSGGATGRTTAKCSALQGTIYSRLRAKHGDDVPAAYAAANRAAVERIGELVEADRIECAFERLPAYTYAADDAQRASVEAEVEAASAAGLPVEWTADPGLPFSVPGAVRLDDQAQFHPVAYVRALAALVEGEGSGVFERTTVTSVGEGSPCRVETDAGLTVTAGSVVVATNYPLLDRGVFFARLEATRSYLVAARVRGDVSEGMLISAGPPTRSVRPYRAEGERWVLVGGEGHETGAGAAQPERYEALEAFAREHWDVRDVPYRWSTQDAMPVDHLPYVGRYTPVSSRLFVATGFQKWGMTNGTVAAMILADTMAGRDNPWARTFEPGRLSVSALPGLARLNLRAAKHLVGDRLKPAEAPSAEAVPRGEARVVRDGLGKVGVYRGADGEVHGVSLRCTHLGCLLSFNAAEATWDCPCHGSRFDVDGAVLQGPAVAPLERRVPPGAGAAA
jgi:glycine/D-amino acid oxidase-like deaminating enzyme/nitrite reductase/ring-hydroxylating ferredoxin subunit